MYKSTIKKDFRDTYFRISEIEEGLFGEENVYFFIFREVNTSTVLQYCDNNISKIVFISQLK